MTRRLSVPTLPFTALALAALAAGTFAAGPAGAACPRERHAFHGDMNACCGRPVEWGSRWIWANAGDRLVAAAVGDRPYPSNVPRGTYYWELRIWSDTEQTWVTYPTTRAYDGGQRMVLDTTARRNGWYKLIVLHTWGNVRGHVFHATFDVSSGTECGPPGYQLTWCHDAVGPDCEATPATRSDVTSDGMRRMEVSVGSMTHDSCCSRNPNGHMCNGPCQDPRQTCKREWDWAVSDQVRRTNFSQLFNPTVPYYPPFITATSTLDRATNRYVSPWGSTFPDGHRVPPHAFLSTPAWCTSKTGSHQWWDGMYCCGTSGNCTLNAVNTQVSMDCSRQRTRQACESLGKKCMWFDCPSWSTTRMRAEPVCMPPNTARYIACPVLHSLSCSDRLTQSECDQVSPRCTWNAWSRRCELRWPSELCSSY